MKQKKILFSYIITGFIIVGLGVYFSGVIENVQKEKAIQTEQVTATNYKTISLYKLYNWCTHLVKQKEYKIPANELKDLTHKYPEEEGWNITREGNVIKLVQRVDGFCPVDSEKRYFGVKDGFLAIYQGPANLAGPLQKVTDIRVENLPLEWQEKVYNKALEFATEAELLEALDSLDEYQ